MKQVAAAIAWRDNRVLVARRAAGEKLAGHWEFPGGKLEAGETVQACIVRELKEELGIRAVAGQLLMESPYVYPGGAINLIAIGVELTDGAFTLTVHDEVRWIALSELLELRLAPADVPIAEELIRRHGGHC